MLVTLMRQLINPPSSHVAVYLSGGIDSSVVLHHVCEKIRTVRTYTTVFGVSTDETAKARRVAEYYGTLHTEVPLTDFVETLPEILRLFDRPHFNVWPYWMARQAAEDGIKTAYIGEGSDEIFGYPDRGYLEGWAGQLIYVRPTYDIVNRHFGIDLKAPFTEMQHYLVAEFGQQAPLAFFKPPVKEILRRAYRDILPPWILATPTTAPAMTNYKEFGQRIGLTGDVKKELQRLATEAWLCSHGLPSS